MPPKPKQRNNNSNHTKYSAYGPQGGSNTNNNNRFHSNRKRQRRQQSNQDEGGTTIRSFVSNHNNKKITVTPTCSVCTIIENPKYKCPKCRLTYCSMNCCKIHKETLCCINNKLPTTEDKGQNENVIITNDEGSNIIQTDTTSTSMKSKYISQIDLIQFISEKKQQQHNDRKEESDSDDDSDDDDGWQITTEMINNMKESIWLKNELKNDIGLRSLIDSIMNKSNRVPKQQHAFDHRNKRKRNVETCMNTNILKTEQELTLVDYKQRYPQFQQFIDKLLVITNILERQPNNNVNMASSSSLTEWLNQNDNNNNTSEYLILKPIERKRRINNNNTMKKLVTELHTDDDIDDEEHVNNNTKEDTSNDDKDDDDDDDSSDDDSTTTSNKTDSSNDS